MDDITTITPQFWERAIEIAREQALWWTTRGLTPHEMLEEVTRAAWAGHSVSLAHAIEAIAWQWLLLDPAITGSDLAPATLVELRRRLPAELRRALPPAGKRGPKPKLSILDIR